MHLTALALSLFAAPSDTPLVARFECAAPKAETFFLRGTLPLPAGHGLEFDRPDHKEPFQIKLTGSGVPFPAQSEIVVRRPDGSAQVVELLARVTRPESAQLDDRLRFDVVLAEHEDQERPVVPTAVQTLLAEDSPASLLLRTRDVYGNVYTVDLCGDPSSG
ncbi:MAG: hypothetical protein AAF368_09455, partial [Planctomycetota bacterium]